MSAFRVLDDEELSACGFGDVVACYQELRSRYEALTRKDRSTILRMAGNIAPGIYQASYPDLLAERDLDRRTEGMYWLAYNAVEIARAVIAEVDGLSSPLVKLTDNDQ